MIFCVEDDQSIREIEIYTLTSMGFEARGLADGNALFEALEEEKPSLIILDVMLPGEDGVSILKRLKSRAETASIPVIMATAKGSEYDKIESLDLGADDYLVKPFGMMEMVSRVRAVMRRAGGGQKVDTISGADIVLSDAEHTVKAHGENVVLTLKEFELLKLLLANPGIVFTREKLLSTVWDASALSETRTVDAHVKTLRQKLGSSGSHIETVRGVGYRFSL